MAFPVDLRFDLDEALAPTTKTTSSSSGSSDDSSSKSDGSNAKTMALITEMPTVRVGGDSVCCVCMERFVVSHQDRRERGNHDHDHHGNAKQLPCGHVYHPDCILAWISSSNHSCPLCRHVLF